MKNVNRVWALALGLVFSMQGASAFAFPDEVIFPTTVLVAPSDVFVPTGFDGNDNVQLIVAGQFVDTCLKAGKLSAEVDEAKRKIILRQGALQYGGCWCAKIPVDYSQSVDLGVLPAGKFEVMVEGPTGPAPQKNTLSIAFATTSSPDDHFYAPVNEASIDAKRTVPTLTLKGTFASSCMGLQEVKVIHKAENVIEVLPITDLREGAQCEPSPRDFETTVELPARSGKTLVHIRSLNGQAINKIMVR
jgi:hypothetical protein